MKISSNKVNIYIKFIKKTSIKNLTPSNQFCKIKKSYNYLHKKLKKTKIFKIIITTII